jgi:hypothetical protein
MMGTQAAPQTSVTFNQLKRLIAQEDSINFGRGESFRSYI